MTDQRRESTPEELKVQREFEAEKRRKEQQTKRIDKNEKIRCPCCKKNQYFDNYLANKVVATLVCPKCGVLFVDKYKLELIKGTIKAKPSTPIITGGTVNGAD